MGVVLELTDCFEILGVQPGAHLREIRSAFRRLALSCHPDIAGPQKAKQFETIAAAYAQLKSATPAQISESLKKQKTHGDSEKGSPFSWKKSPPRRPKSERRDERERESSKRVQDLLLEKALVEAELSMARILEKATRKDEKRAFSSLAKRLLSTHPGVRVLALGALSGRLPEKAVFSAMIEMLRMWPPDDDTVEHILLLDFSDEQKADIAAALSARSVLLSEASALALLRWAAVLPVKMSVVRKLLSHPSSRVLSQALARWSEKSLPDDLTLIRLLKREEEDVLVPLLRILKDRSVPVWAYGRVKMLAENPVSSAVRVWAQSIVRAQNLV
jgi:curved DNA-binding protein CbpA